MTAIAGIAENARTWIGGDSAGLSGWTSTARADRKIFARDHNARRWIFGYTTSFRFGQLLQFELDLPEHTPVDHDDDETWLEHMVTRFIPNIRTCITAAQPGTWTLCLRGRKSRSWGFYQPEGWVHWQSYDYATRRPEEVQSSHPEENTCGNPRCDDPSHRGGPMSGAQESHR